ncbi:MAG TPA: pitrilysin family protein [Gemmatimonadales bacterium]|nr:pitrilysin family protein [Gemmatimonadales bacterium]
MITRILLTAATLALPAAARAQTPTVSKFTAGGITVIHKPIAANDVVAARLYVRGGAAALTPTTAGIERFIGEVSTHGTDKYTKDQFATLATVTGTNIGAAADFDFTVYTVQAVRQHWSEAWDLFIQAALHPTFPAEEVEQVRGQIRDALAQRRDNPDQHVQELADSVLYAGQPYALDPDGVEQVIGKLTRDDLVGWHHRRFTKANLLLVVVGNVSRTDLTAMVTAAFDGLPATGGEARLAAPLTAGRPELAVVQQDLPTNYILGVYPAPTLSSADYPALRVAARVLSERFFEEVRTKRNLSYAVASGLGGRAANRGNIYVTAVDPDTTLRVMQTEVRRLQRDLIPASRLGQTINVFLTTYLMSQQTNMGQAADLGVWEITGGGWANAAAYLSRIRAVTPADVQRVARAYMQRFTFAVIGDPAKLDRGFVTSF